MESMQADKTDPMMSKLVVFYYLDNEKKSAQDFGQVLLQDMEQFWDDNLLSTLLKYMQVPLWAPRQCIKLLRVLHEITTHCTKVDLKRLVFSTELLSHLTPLLVATQPRGVLVGTLTLLSNLVVSGWRVRDALVESGIVTEVLHLLAPRHEQQPQLEGQVLWLLYHVLKYKVPGPAMLIVTQIARAMPKLLIHSRDVNLLLPSLQLARLLLEYRAVVPAIIGDMTLLRSTVRFTLSPERRLQREALFVLANLCQQRRVGALYRYPKSILQYLHCLVLGGSLEVRVLVLHLLGSIVDNMCISSEYFVSIGLLDKIVWCVCHDRHMQVQLAASWTLVSLAAHIGPKQLRPFVALGGMRAICIVLTRRPPLRMLRNILALFASTLLSLSHGKEWLLHAMAELGVWPQIAALQRHRNAVLCTLSQHLTFQHARDLCSVDVDPFLIQN